MAVIDVKLLVASTVEYLDELVYFDLRCTSSLVRALFRVQGLNDIFVSRQALRRLTILLGDQNVASKQSLFHSRPNWN
jgi:hypothetical protein